MVVRALLIIILTGVLFAYDYRLWKSSKRKDRIVYALLTVPAVYLAIIYVTGVDWPNLDDFAELGVGRAAKSIVNAIKLPS